MFLFTSNYLKPIEEVMEFRKEHLEFLQNYMNTGNLLLAGRKESLDGGVLLCNFQSLSEAQSFINEDPYVINDCAKYVITEFDPSVANQEIKKIIK